MGLDWATWPPLGLLGVSRSPATGGQHVYIVADSVDEYWIVLCEHPAANFVLGDCPMSDDNYFISDEDVRIAVHDWAIEWLPSGPEEEALERALFGMRNQVERARRRRSRWSKWRRRPRA